jgi:uncharacterized membrane protein YgaE (UPF0421/DUF939 family)
MNVDPYFLVLVGGAFSLVGVLIGIILRQQLREKEIERLETFQKMLSDQNSRLLSELKEKELEKFDDLCLKIYNRIGDVSTTLKENNRNNQK